MFVDKRYMARQQMLINNQDLFFQLCLQLDADDRPTCSQLLRNEFFQKDGFASRFAQELKVRKCSVSDCIGIILYLCTVTFSSNGLTDTYWFFRLSDEML